MSPAGLDATLLPRLACFAQPKLKAPKRTIKSRWNCGSKRWPSVGVITHSCLNLTFPCVCVLLLQLQTHHKEKMELREQEMAKELQAYQAQAEEVGCTE